MVLPDTKKVIILNAGHFDDPNTLHVEESGARYNNVLEVIECMKVRDRVIELLEARGYVVHKVPDHLNLRDSIDWANKRAKSLNDALAIDIHFNYLSDRTARGTETFHGVSSTSKKIAAELSSHLSKEMGIPNRGAKPDTMTSVGSLGWIRKTSMWASLVEVCFLTNNDDMNVLHGENGYAKAARGIANGIDSIFGVEREPKTSPEENQTQPNTKCTLAIFTVSQLISELMGRFTGVK